MKEYKLYRTDNGLHLSDNAVENRADDILLVEPLRIAETFSVDFEQLLEECRFTAITGTEQQQFLLFLIQHGILLQRFVPFTIVWVSGLTAAHGREPGRSKEKQQF